ncbi:MAG: FIST C-terminal domain-containing protein [Nitrospirota bacterium]|nr:FIST C-terminal domain-containing protein [Nitrospirota bacterium]MDH5587124.1 FIST C-terminal domain-containing protein [Nitrospirota bacterium]MDH5775454.1 FIST C-terminal domain-containing protein [Nitrospirota bacterium]
MNVQTFCLDQTNPSIIRPDFVQDPQQSLVILFGASSFLESPARVQEVCQTFSGIPIIGCSTSGEVFGSEIKDESLVGGILQFERTTVQTTTIPISESSQSFQVGQQLATELMRPDLRGVLVLSDGLTVNGSELIRGMNEVLPESVVITGGLAGDGDRFKQTWVLRNNTPTGGFVTAVGFYGDHIRLGHGSKGGWDYLGPERRVTRSKDNVLYELDGKPALELYKEYLGERASGLPATALLFPLALKQEETGDDYLVRTILAVDETDQSMTFAGNIPQDSLVQLMRGNFDRLITGASEAALQTNSKDVQNTLAIAITCVGRRLVLGERAEEEIEATLEVFPQGTQQIGFYSYGELSPYANGRCNLHNQTMTVTTISEQ